MTITAIDSHVHIWNRTHGETFIAEAQFPVLKGQSFMPEDLVPVLRDTKAGQAVLVHGPANVAHSRYCLELCNEHDIFKSVIGWVDLRDTQKMGPQIAELSEDQHFRGIRLTPILDADPEGYLRSDAAQSAAELLATNGQILEVLAPVPLLAATHDLCRANPETPVVIAHFGLPSRAPDRFEAWRDAMHALSKCDNTLVKVSGLPLTGDEPADFQMTCEHLAPLLDWFGPERLMYASNWPVATALATPAYWHTVLDKSALWLGLTKTEQRQLLFETCDRIY